MHGKMNTNTRSSSKPSIRMTTRIVALVTFPTGPDCHYYSAKCIFMFYSDAEYQVPPSRVTGYGRYGSMTKYIGLFSSPQNTKRATSPSSIRYTTRKMIVFQMIPNIQVFMCGKHDRFQIFAERSFLQVVPLLSKRMTVTLPVGYM